MDYGVRLNNAVKCEHLYLKNGDVNPAVYAKDFIVWGNGGDSERFFNRLPMEGKARLCCFADSSPNLIGKTRHGKRVIAKDELTDYGAYNIVLAFNKWRDVIYDKPLTNFHKEQIYADFIFCNPSNETCILCGGGVSEDNAHFTPFIEKREFGDCPPMTKLLVCDNCNFAFSSYRPTDKEMSALYNGYRDEKYYELRHSLEPQYTRAFNDIFLQNDYIEQRRSRVWNFLEKFVSGVKSVLDYGGDRGQMIPLQFSNIRRAVFDISAMQPLDGVELITDVNVVRNDNFDLVLCEHLLEHVANPLEIIDNIVRATAKNGYIYIEVPYETNWQNYSDYPFSEHINFYYEETMRFIGEKFGLNKIKILTENQIINRALYKKS